MEEQEFSDKIDHPETLPPPPSPSTDVNDVTDAAAVNSREAEAQRPALSQRLTEAFREGVASARPDYDPRPVAETAPRAKKNRPESSDAGIMGRVIREGGAAAVGVGEKASGVLGGFIKLVKKTPNMTQKYAEAFRAGAASVHSRGGREQGAGATAPKSKGASFDGRAILGRVFKAGESAAGFVREAVSVVKPGEVIGASQKIRLGQKKINQLYIDIGGEAASSWSGGLVETEKLTALLAELRQSEADIQAIQAQIAAVGTAGKAAAARKRQTIKKETASTAAANQEDSRVDAGDSGAVSDEPVEPPLIDDLEDQVLTAPESRVDAGDSGVTLDESVEQPLIDALEEEVASTPENRVEFTPEVGDLSVAVAPDVEVTESYALSEQIDAEEAAPQEESDSDADPALPEDSDLNQGKKSGAKKDKKRERR